MHSKDSLIGLNLRLGQKRPRTASTQSRLPIDELRARVVAKRRRTDGTEKAVRFNTKGNHVHVISKSGDDLRAAWMSREESARVRASNIRTIESVRAGKLDTANDTLRGLELHSTEELLHKKIENGGKFVRAVLEQQRFLRSAMGRASDVILGRLSSVLSSEDAKDAAHTASIDEREAALIHSEDYFPESNRQQKQSADVGSQSPDTNMDSACKVGHSTDIAPFPNESLSRLLAQPNPVFPKSA